MKKFIIIITVLAITGINLSSCVKMCNCKEYKNGELMLENQEPIETGHNCSDLTIDNSELAGVKEGVFCE